jgi:hypothetical protein
MLLVSQVCYCELGFREFGYKEIAESNGQFFLKALLVFY